MPIIEINTLEQPGIEVYGTLTEAQLRNRLEPDKGIFIAESPKVIHVALDAGYEPLSLLCERRHITGDAASIIERCGDIPVYTGERDLLARLTGYTLTRGVLCAMRRPTPPSIEEVCRNAHVSMLAASGNAFYRLCHEGYIQTVSSEYISYNIFDVVLVIRGLNSC